MIAGTFLFNLMTSHTMGLWGLAIVASGIAGINIWQKGAE